MASCIGKIRSPLTFPSLCPSPAFLDTREPLEMALLEQYGREAVCSVMAAGRVVEHLAVVEDIGLGLLAVWFRMVASSPRWAMIDAR